MLTASINLDVPALPENDVWFANAAAWSNYWANIDVSVTFDGADTTAYAESAFDSSLKYIAIPDSNGGLIELPTRAQFDSLLLAYQTLNTSIKAMRAALADAGIITNA